MKKLYHLYDTQTLEISGAAFFEEGQQPNNAIYIETYNFKKGMFNPTSLEVYEGATIEEIEYYNKSLVPKVVSQRQLRTQLILSSFNLGDVQSAINTLSEPNKSIAQVAWDYAVTFERDSPLLLSLAFSLGLSENDVDNIFINASQL